MLLDWAELLWAARIKIQVLGVLMHGTLFPVVLMRGSPSRVDYPV
jgi:hypothetical protein